MKKILISLLVVMFLATSAYALNNTTEGPKNIVTCYIIGTAACTSGNVVVLTDAEDTTRTIEFYGREVTASSTVGEPIYGVIVDTRQFSVGQKEVDSTLGQVPLGAGAWIRVQTYGYHEGITLATDSGSDENNSIYTSGTVFKADGTSGAAETYGVTSNCVALEAFAIGVTANETVKAFLLW